MCECLFLLSKMCEWSEILCMARIIICEWLKNTQDFVDLAQGEDIHKFIDFLRLVRITNMA